MKEISERQFEIIEAAGRILTESGVKGLTIKNLAKEMGFSESAIYRHFESKEKIIVGMLNFLARDMDKRFAKAVTSFENPKDQFRSLFQSQFIFFKSNSHFVAAVFSDGLMEESKNINEAIYKIMAVKMKHLKPVLQAGIKSNDFTDKIPMEDLLHVVMGTFRLQMFKWRVSHFDFDLIARGDKTITSVLTLIENNPIVIGSN